MASNTINRQGLHRPTRSYLLYAMSLLTALIVGACSSQLTSTPTAAPTAPSEVTEATPVPPLSSEKSATSSILETETPVARSYHALLMLERSTDLMLTVIEQISAGKIARDDTSAISAYTNAFPVAVDAFNQVMPPGEFEDIWTQVYMAVQQYNQAYTMLVSKFPVSEQNLGYLRETRQLLKIDQEMVEKYLSQQSGWTADSFSEEQQAIDEHFQKAYGDRPVPTLLP